MIGRTIRSFLAVAAVTAPAVALTLPVAAFAHGRGVAAQAHAAAHGRSVAEASQTVSGVVGVDASGYTLTSGSSVYELRLGPVWYHGMNSLVHVGQAITVTGSIAGTTLHVRLIDGLKAHGHGRPPWAGKH